MEAAADELLRRLTFYRLRAAVELAIDARIPTSGDGGSADPRSSALPQRAYATAGDWDATAHARARVDAGVPEAGEDFAYAEVFPHDVLMDRFDAPGAGVAFRKGCYVGQEVVSRMQHRGTARRRPVVLRSREPLAGGQSVDADGREIGTVGTVADDRALAIVRLDRIEAAALVTVAGQRSGLAAVAPARDAMTPPRLWVTAEEGLVATLAAEPAGCVLSFGSPSRQTVRPEACPWPGSNLSPSMI